MDTEREKQIQKLERELVDAEIDLNIAQNQLNAAEDAVYKLHKKIKNLKYGFSRECLPIELFNTGYFLEQDEDTKKIKLLNREKDCIKEWNFTPSLGDLMDIKEVAYCGH